MALTVCPGFIRRRSSRRVSPGSRVRVTPFRACRASRKRRAARWPAKISSWDGPTPARTTKTRAWALEWLRSRTSRKRSGAPGALRWCTSRRTGAVGRAWRSSVPVASTFSGRLLTTSPPAWEISTAVGTKRTWILERASSRSGPEAQACTAMGLSGAVPGGRVSSNRAAGCRAARPSSTRSRASSLAMPPEVGTSRVAGRRAAQGRTVTGRTRLVCGQDRVMVASPRARPVTRISRSATWTAATEVSETAMVGVPATLSQRAGRVSPRGTVSRGGSRVGSEGVFPERASSRREAKVRARE